jgi:hypothetical protein
LGPKSKRSTQYTFFDPETGDDMPREYLPAYRFNRWERDEGWGGQSRKTPLPEFDPLVKVGEEVPGRYAAPDNMIYHGVGRVCRVQQFEGRGICAMVEPIPGKA